MTENFITIFTPTFNRAYILPKLYQSLCNQTSQNFEWLLVDDGSTDNTKELITKWISENQIIIRYVYQENSGKSAAHNKGVELAKGNLFTCVDSDDYLVPEAIDTILNHWSTSEDIIGLVFARGFSEMESNTKWGKMKGKGTLISAYQKYGFKGDTMLVYQTSLIKKYRFPTFEGEKFVPESYLYDLLDKEGELRFINSILYVGDYLDDGYTKSIRKLIFNNPRGYQAYIVNRISADLSLKDKLKDLIKYNAIQFVLSEKKYHIPIKENILRYLTLPLGYIFYKKEYARFKGNRLKN